VEDALTSPNVETVVARLARIEADAPVVLSCYLRLDVPFRQGKLYLATLKERARALSSQLETRGLGREDLRDVRADLERILTWAARPGNLPSLPGAGVFACRRLGLFEVIALPRVHRVRVAVDHRPLLHELFDARERLDHYLAVVIDRERARFFEVAADGTTELSGLRPPARRGGRFRSDRRDSPGWGERHYHNRMASEKHRHFAEVAREAGRLLRAGRLKGVAVMGPSVHAKAMVEFLPDGVRQQLLGVAHLNPTAVNPAEVGQTTWLLQAERERADEARLLDALEEAVPRGWAVNGVRETLRALARGQARSLLVPEQQQGSGFRCSGTGRLVVARAHCRGEGEPVAVANLVDAAIDEALRQGADVRVIDDPQQAKRVDGLATMLRFREG
jgi:peptide subunit release factor 1 (eRF1)